MREKEKKTKKGEGCCSKLRVFNSHQNDNEAAHTTLRKVCTWTHLPVYTKTPNDNTHCGAKSCNVYTAVPFKHEQQQQRQGLLTRDDY